MGRSLQRPGLTRTFAPGTASVLVFGKRDSPTSRIISNVGVDPVYVGFSANIDAAAGFQLLPGQAMVTNTVGVVWCSGSSATSLVSVLEEA